MFTFEFVNILYIFINIYVWTLYFIQYKICWVYKECLVFEISLSYDFSVISLFSHIQYKIVQQILRCLLVNKYLIPSRRLKFLECMNAYWQKMSICRDKSAYKKKSRHEKCGKMWYDERRNSRPLKLRGLKLRTLKNVGLKVNRISRWWDNKLSSQIWPLFLNLKFCTGNSVLFSFLCLKKDVLHFFKEIVFSLNFLCESKIFVLKLQENG